MIGAKDWKVEANSPFYLHLDWVTGVFGKDAIPDGDGRAGGGDGERRRERRWELLSLRGERKCKFKF
jgi:hypothetical protein